MAFVGQAPRLSCFRVKGVGESRGERRWRRRKNIWSMAYFPSAHAAEPSKASGCPEGGSSALRLWVLVGGSCSLHLNIDCADIEAMPRSRAPRRSHRLWLTHGLRRPTYLRRPHALRRSHGLRIAATPQIAATPWAAAIISYTAMLCIAATLQASATPWAAALL